MARPRRETQIAQASEPMCDEGVVHVEEVRAAREGLPTPAHIDRLTDLFAAMADPTRLRIIVVLRRRELCVCDVAATVGLTTSAASHQLRALRDRHLVRGRRDGRRMYYALDDDHVITLIDTALSHIDHGHHGDTGESS